MTSFISGLVIWEIGVLVLVLRLWFWFWFNLILRHGSRLVLGPYISLLLSTLVRLLRDRILSSSSASSGARVWLCIWYVMQVNGGQRAGSLSPEFDDMDNSTLPTRLVYNRPPSTSNHHPQQYTFNSRRDRYASTDGVTLLPQVAHASHIQWYIPSYGLSDLWREVSRPYTAPTLSKYDKPPHIIINIHSTQKSS